MPPTAFVYHKRPFSIGGTLWSLWLRLPSSIRLAFYNALSRLATWHHGPENLYVVRLPFGLYAKSAFNVVEEGLATQYVQENTRIPVPTILDVILGDYPEYPNRGLILMTAIPGKGFGRTRVLIDSMSDEQRITFTTTLRDWFDQLRSLPPPDNRMVTGFAGGGLYSHRIQDVAEGPVGPFRSQDDFHIQPFCDPWPPYDENLRAALEKRRKTRYKICLTHGDITPNNILVDENLRPTGLVDWETASWMPEYWEYTRAIWIRERYKGWCDVFRQIFPDYASELQVESAVWRHFHP